MVKRSLQLKARTILIKLMFVAVFCVLFSNGSIATTNAATTISQGYSASEPVSPGTIVSLKDNTSDQVEPSTVANAENVLGIVVNQGSSMLSLSNGANTQVQVTTGGTVNVMVSNINGDIKRGDHITASPITGLGMKATGNVRVVGIAQGDVGNTKQQTYKDKAGKEHSVVLGEVPTLVNVAYFFKEPEKTIIPSTVQNVANAIAGRSVSTVPIIVSAGIFLIMLIVVSSIVYSMIRSSIISVGRNPMSQSAVYRDVIQLSALVLVIIGASLTVIYLVLTKL